MKQKKTTFRSKLKRINLWQSKADNILDDIVNLFPNYECYPVNLYPNLPYVRDRVKAFIVKESPLWILTLDISNKAHDDIENKDLSPFYGCNDTIESFTSRYYNK